MIKLNISQIIELINKREAFEAVASDYSFTLKIESYVPYVCGAIHDGHQFRKELWDNYLHSEYDRWYEEDPCTKQMIQSHPIVIAGCDSRFEYDLNRAPETAIYEDAWGKQLWKSPLPDAHKQKSLLKHTNFYKVVHALIEALETDFGSVIVYDMHSYNWRRWDREVPTWNLGTANIDNKRFGEFIESWRAALESLELPNGIQSTSKLNDTFQGNGYFLKYITQHFRSTLVLATEIAKIYCHEYEAIIYPEVVSSVEKQLKTIVLAHANTFRKAFCE
jgi:hypothetical protein